MQAHPIPGILTHPIRRPGENMRNLWQARLGGAPGGARGTLGAGFLIDSRRVITCAHVVRDSSDITVTFGQARRRDLVAVPAKVVFLGPWSRPGDGGDVAVVELEREVDLIPAYLKRCISGPSSLVPHGFPAGQ